MTNKPSYEIKCGKCSTEYNPRVKESQEYRLDYSCPVCKHGKMLETQQMNAGKIILKD